MTFSHQTPTKLKFDDKKFALWLEPNIDCEGGNWFAQQMLYKLLN
jgi:hypothetical protein